ncbi:hypothetical protein ES703_111112 [subsurface metagenome]
MNKKLLIGIIVVFVIAAVIFKPMFIGTVLLGVWIYLVFMVRKKKTKIFHDQVEPKIAERRLKMLKAFLLVGGISLGMLITFLVGVILYNVVYGLDEMDEIADIIAHSIGFSLLGVFYIATIGGLVIFLKGRRKTTLRV